MDGKAIVGLVNSGTLSYAAVKPHLQKNASKLHVLKI